MKDSMDGGRSLVGRGSGPHNDIEPHEFAPDPLCGCDPISSGAESRPQSDVAGSSPVSGRPSAPDPLAALREPEAWAAWLEAVRRYAPRFASLSKHFGTSEAAAEIIAGAMLSYLASDWAPVAIDDHEPGESAREDAQRELAELRIAELESVVNEARLISQWADSPWEEPVLRAELAELGREARAALQPEAGEAG